MENDEKEDRLMLKFSGISAARILPEQVKGNHTIYKHAIGMKAQINTIDAHHRQVRIASYELLAIKESRQQ